MPDRISTDSGHEFELTFDPRKGGSIRAGSGEFVAGRSYTFRTWVGQELFEWRNVAGDFEEEAGSVTFVLPATVSRC